MLISISASVSSLPGYKLVVEDEVPVIFFNVTSRLTREEIRAFNNGTASHDVLTRYDAVEAEAMSILKNAEYSVKHVNYGVFAANKGKYYKVEPGVAGKVRLTPVTKRCWSSNGRFK